MNHHTRNPERGTERHWTATASAIGALARLQIGRWELGKAAGIDLGNGRGAEMGVVWPRRECVLPAGDCTVCTVLMDSPGS